jgi:hypothetical protein
MIRLGFGLSNAKANDYTEDKWFVFNNTKIKRKNLIPNVAVFTIRPALLLSYAFLAVKALANFTLLNSRSLIFRLTLFGWLHSTTLTTYF